MFFVFVLVCFVSAFDGVGVSTVSSGVEFVEEVSVTSTTLVYVGGVEVVGVYGRDKGRYLVNFSSGVPDVVLSGFGAFLRVVPLSWNVGEKTFSPDVDLRFVDDDTVEYRGMFDGKGKIRYEMRDKELKESIIYSSVYDLPGADISSTTRASDSLVVSSGFDPSSSTMSVEYRLVYPSYIEPRERDGEIRFVRRREHGRVYLQNNFFTIKSPYVKDSEGKRFDLGYELVGLENESMLRLYIPPVLDSLKFPIEIDPTIGIDGIDGWYRFNNTENCSTASSDCVSIADDFTDTYVVFEIQEDCASYGNAYKDIFEFNLDDLYEYDEPLDYATVYLEGNCDHIDDLPNTSPIGIYHIEPYEDETPSCGDDPFGTGNERELVKTLRTEGGTCYEGELYFSATSILEDALADSEDYLGFKIDMSPPNAYNHEPTVADDSKYQIKRSSNDLYLEYRFTCDYSNDCPSDEFCRDSTPDYCKADYADGIDCENKATDDDNESCTNGVCEYDGFDGADHYCSDGTHCVNDGELFDFEQWHCEGETYAKQCGADGDWGSQIDCDYGCNATQGGCLTTSTTTTSTTTTTTTTTLAPDIHVDKQQLTITVIR